MVKLGVRRLAAALLLAAFCLALTGDWFFAQQPQAQSGQPLYAVNAKYVNGVAPGYWPTAGTGLVLNISAGTAFCGGSAVTTPASTLTLTASATNSVFLLPTALGAPATPVLSTATTGGSLAAGTYLVKITYVNPSGESSTSAEASITTTGTTSTITITAPAANTNGTGWNAYVTAVGGASGTETKQNTTAIAIGTNLTITSIVTGAALPTADTTACAPWFNTTGFLAHHIPIANVVTGATAITSITDVRSHGFFSASPYKVEAVNFTPVTVTNTLTETILMTFSLPANDLGANQVLRIHASGVFSTDAVTAPTLTLRVRAGGVAGTILGSTGAFQTVVSQANSAWSIDFYVIGTAAPGAAAPTESQGGAYFAAVNASAAGAPLGMANSATVAWATNTTQTIAITATWSVAATTDTITQRQLIAERLN